LGTARTARRRGKVADRILDPRGLVLRRDTREED
jgi:hypothetical protein